MNWYEILIIVAAAAFVLGVVVWQIVRKKKGKLGCDCGGECAQCPHCKTVGGHSAPPFGHSERSEESPDTKSEL